MNVHDKAYDLARAIKESSEYQEMQQIRMQIDEEPAAKSMLDDFRTHQAAFQQKMAVGEMPPQADMDRMQNMYEAMAHNPSIKKLFDAERRLSVVLEDVQ